jgi:hypothetical protein
MAAIGIGLPNEERVMMRISFTFLSVILSALPLVAQTYKRAVQMDDRFVITDWAEIARSNNVVLTTSGYVTNNQQNVTLGLASGTTGGSAGTTNVLTPNGLVDISDVVAASLNAVVTNDTRNLYFSGNRLRFGDGAGEGATGDYMHNLGRYAGYYAIGNYMYNFGYFAGNGASGINMHNFGHYAGNIATGDDMHNIGYFAGNHATGNYMHNIGTGAGDYATGNYMHNFGYFAGARGRGDYMHNFGHYAGYYGITTNSTIIGKFAGRNARGRNVLFLDSYAAAPGEGHSPTNDNLYIDGDGRLHLGRPSGNTELRGTVHFNGLKLPAYVTNIAEAVFAENITPYVETNDTRNLNFTGVVTIDAANDRTNTFGGKVTILGETVRAGADNTVGVYGFGAGVDNTIGIYGFGAGFDNIVGDYGFAAGYNTHAGYGGFVAGESTYAGQYGFAAGQGTRVGALAFGAGEANIVGDCGFGAGIANTVGRFGFGAGFSGKGGEGSFVFSDFSAYDDFDRSAYTNEFAFRAQRIYWKIGPQVIDEIESTLTDNTNALPTSAAVVAYVAAHGGGGTAAPLVLNLSGLLIYDAAGSNLHFEVEIATNSAFAASTRHCTTNSVSGWEYFNGGEYAAFPEAGLPEAYHDIDGKASVIFKPGIASSSHYVRARAWNGLDWSDMRAAHGSGTIRVGAGAVYADAVSAEIVTNIVQIVAAKPIALEQYVSTHITLADAASVVIPGTAAQYTLTVTQPWELSLTNGHPRYSFALETWGTNIMTIAPAWHVVNTNFVPWEVNMHSITPYGTTNWSIFSSGVSQ